MSVRLPIRKENKKCTNPLDFAREVYAGLETRETVGGRVLITARETPGKETTRLFEANAYFEGIGGRVYLSHYSVEEGYSAVLGERPSDSLVAGLRERAEEIMSSLKETDLHVEAVRRPTPNSLELSISLIPPKNE